MEEQEVAIDVEGVALVSEEVLSLRCLSQKANAGFFLPAWFTGSSMMAQKGGP